MSDIPFRQLPSVARLLELPALVAAREQHPHHIVTDTVRAEVESLRAALASGETPNLDAIAIAARVVAKLEADAAPKIRPVVNATGVVLHTNLGRSPLQTFLRSVVPLMLGGILSGVVLTWVTVASELSATVVLYSGPWRTMTVVMFQALEGSGAGIATAAASTLIVVTLVPIALLYRLVRRYELSML